MLTHRQLRYFVEIVDARSFSAAAERLFVAQSALSRQVRETESELQVTLLVRDSRHLDLTPAGQSLYDDARRILAALADAQANAVHAQRGTQGALQLLHSSSVPLAPRLLAVLRRHAEQHPGVAVEIAQASSEQQALDIHEGCSDVGLARGPILRRYADVHYDTLYEERLVLAVAQGHALAHKTDVALSVLRDERFVALPHVERGGLSHGVSELCRASGFQPQPALVRSRKWAQLALVQAGFGIAIVPESMGQMVPHGVRVIELQGDHCTSAVVALWRHDAPPLVRRFVGLLKTESS
jgi:DNA-binding transcriptional LysR family regulator